jgi:2-polyprenyl-6-methoxyphenol hydroxylase-like FAD-dependent oxidoreductase
MRGALAPGARILVVGGAIGGLTAGIALRRAGFDPLVLERHHAPAEVGAGLSLWPNAVHPLRALGVGDAIAAAGLDPGGGALRLADGRTLASLPGGRLEERFGAPMLVVHRADLIGSLRAALPPTALRDGAHVTDVHEHADGVTATLEDGERIEGALLVGADGVRSLVRERLWNDRPAAPSGVVAWRAVVSMGDALAPLEGEAWGRGLLFGAVPLRGERIYWFASASADEHGETSPEREREMLQARFARWRLPVAPLIRRTDPVTIIRTPLLERAVAAPLARGRVALIGDAAHPMFPNLGQGGCQAIEDAVELASALANEPDLTSALGRYEQARRGRVTKIVARSRRTGQAALLTSRPLAVLRNLALRCTPQSATVRSITPVVGHRPSTP